MLVPLILILILFMTADPSSSLEEVWVTVLNITGPLSSWSFADSKLPG